MISSKYDPLPHRRVLIYTWWPVGYSENPRPLFAANSLSTSLLRHKLYSSYLKASFAIKQWAWKLVSYPRFRSRYCLMFFWDGWESLWTTRKLFWTFKNAASGTELFCWRSPSCRLVCVCVCVRVWKFNMRTRVGTVSFRVCNVQLVTRRIQAWKKKHTNYFLLCHETKGNKPFFCIVRESEQFTGSSPLPAVQMVGYLTSWLTNLLPCLLESGTLEEVGPDRQCWSHQRS